MLNHPIRLAGAALTLVVAALACVVMFVPIAAGSSPSGKDQVKRYASIKSGAPLKIVSRGEIFQLIGANFGDVASKVDEIDCLNEDKASPTYMDCESFYRALIRGSLSWQKGTVKIPWQRIIYSRCHGCAYRKPGFR